MDYYRPKHQTQRDDSECWTRNCWVKVTSWMTDGATGGKVKPSTTKVRRKAVKPCPSPGGIMDAIRVLLKTPAAKGRYTYRVDLPKAKLRALLEKRNTGRLIMVETDFERWPHDTGGDFYHSLGIICGQGRGTKRGQVLVMDPLERRYRWVDIDDVMFAIMEYNREHGEKKGTADVLVVRPPKV